MIISRIVVLRGRPCTITISHTETVLDISVWLQRSDGIIHSWDRIFRSHGMLNFSPRDLLGRAVTSVDRSVFIDFLTESEVGQVDLSEIPKSSPGRRKSMWLVVTAVLPELGIGFNRESAVHFPLELFHSRRSTSQDNRVEEQNKAVDTNARRGKKYRTSRQDIEKRSDAVEKKLVQEELRLLRLKVVKYKREAKYWEKKYITLKNVSEKRAGKSNSKMVSLPVRTRSTSVYNGHIKRPSKRSEFRIRSLSTPARFDPTEYVKKKNKKRERVVQKRKQEIEKKIRGTHPRSSTSRLSSASSGTRYSWSSKASGKSRRSFSESTLRSKESKGSSRSSITSNENTGNNIARGRGRKETDMQSRVALLRRMIRKAQLF